MLFRKFDVRWEVGGMTKLAVMLHNFKQTINNS